MGQVAARNGVDMKPGGQQGPDPAMPGRGAGVLSWGDGGGRGSAGCRRGEIGSWVRVQEEEGKA